ncbi:MAG TPA: extracellular solute-binding protein [Clostridia bacterium]
MKKFLTILLILTMTFSLFACKPKNNYDELDFTETDDLVEYTFWAFNWNSYAGTKSDRIISYIENKFNVKINLTGVSEDSWKTKINLLVANDTAPDLFFYTPGTSVYRTWVSDGMLLKLDPYIEKAQAQNLKSILNSNQIKYSTFDGNHYFVPNIFGEMNHAMYVRKDWMNKWINSRGLDIEYPETLEQFADMLKFFTTEDPDGNGKNDTVGMAASSETAWLDNFCAAFGIQPNWTKTGDDYEISALTDGYKEFLQYFANLYSKGYIYKDFYTLNDAEKLELFTSGKAGVVISNNGATVDHIVNQMSNSTLKGLLNDKDDYLDYIDIINMPSGEFAGGYQGNNWYYGGFSISYKVQEPMRLIRILDYLMSEEGQMLRLFGLKDVHYSIDEQGNIVPNLAERVKEGARFQITDLTTAKQNGKYLIGVYFSENRVSVDQNNDLQVTYDYQIYTNQELIKKSYDMIAQSELNYDDGAFIVDYSKNYYDKLNQIKDEIKNTFILVVSGQKTVDSQLDYLKKRLNAIGYNQVKQEYKSTLTKFGVNS